MMIAGAVILTAGVAAPGVASAQESVAERNAMRAEIPWYERFTYAQTGSESSMLGPVDRRGPQAWTPSTRWGITVNLREAERVATTPLQGDQAAVGAYYQFTPSVRVGGQVTLGARGEPPLAAGRRDAEEEASAGVRLESAFRF